MAKTLDDLETLLTGHGYACEQRLDCIVATKLATETYENATGEKALDVFITIDRANDCVALEALHAFDLRQAAHREAMLACLMTASGRTPLVRPGLEPEGDVRLRVDCAFGPNGASDQHVLLALAVLPRFVDNCYAQVMTAMKRGKFEPHKLPHLHLSRMTSAAKPAAPNGPPATAAETPAADQPRRTFGATIDAALKAASLSQKPGAHANRVRVLFDFRRFLDEEAAGPSPDGESDPGSPEQT